MKCCHKIVLLLSTIAVVVFCGCSKKEWYESTEPPSAEKIVKTNEIRNELGLREIKNDWTFEGRTTNKDWVKLRLKLKKDLGEKDINEDSVFRIYEHWKDNMGYKRKSVTYNKHEEIIAETDFYYSGRSFRKRNNDPPIKEGLRIVYNYHKNHNTLITIASDDEKILSLRKELDKLDQSNEEELRIVEKILKRWGLQRL